LRSGVAVHGRYFGATRPANSLVEVSALIGDYKVEIEAERCSTDQPEPTSCPMRDRPRPPASTTGIVWDSHSGFSPGPSVDLSRLAQWRRARARLLVDQCRFDVMPWGDTVKALTAFGADPGASAGLPARRTVDQVAAGQEGEPPGGHVESRA